MDDLISICLPTYRRPDLLREALASCFAQRYPAIEILVGDDSDDDRTERLVRELRPTGPHELRYLRNTPSRGQAGNVNLLFDVARGGRLVLLHDDDLLLPNAVADLSSCWDTHPDVVAAFGKQQLISMAGELLARETDALNRTYRRTSRLADSRLPALEAALLGQLPNNGFLVLSTAAKAVGYRTRDVVGDGCDYDFGIRLASRFGRFHFLDAYTSRVRLTEVSVTTAGRFGAMFPMVQALELPASAEYARTIALQRLAPFAVRDYALEGRRRQALGVYLSPFYPMRQRARLQGLYHLALCFWPGLARLRPAKRRR